MKPRPPDARQPRPKLAAPPSGDSKQEMQWDAKPVTIHTKLGDASLKVRFEASHRRAGETTVRGEVGGRDSSVRIGEVQQIFNRELSANADKYAAKFKTALVPSTSSS